MINPSIAQININTAANFPDANFRSCVESFMGVAPGGVFTATEAAAMTGTLDCASQTIGAVTGIEYFSSLEAFDCSNNQLTYLDISNASDLIQIDCSWNQIGGLVIAGASSLTNLKCNNNQLTDITSLIASPILEASDEVDLRYNNLTCDDWRNILTLENRGVIVNYSPQNGMDPFYCAAIDNINTATNFPDPQFRDFVEEYMGVVSGGVFTATEAAVKTDHFICCFHNISSMTGIEYFTGIDLLYCYRNQLTSLDVSKNTALETLYCYQNQLTYLNISNNPALLDLDCFGNQLTSLDVSNATALEELSCYGNQLTDLDVSQNLALNFLSCFSNQLTSLDLSNNSLLERLFCSQNHLNSLDVMNNPFLKRLSCLNNQLISISSLTANPGLGSGDEVDVRYNNLTCDDWDDIIALQNRGVILSYSPQNGMDPFVCASSDNINTATNFPDPNFRSAVENFMGVAPGGIFTATNAASKTGRIDCEYDNITDMTGIEFFTGIQEIFCNNNQLTSLDLSQNVALTFLQCYNNQLSSLNVSSATSLVTLLCNNNQLTSLDVSQNTLLELLRCEYNQLTSLDISHNIALIYLYCYNNGLTSLNVSNNTALENLSCYHNELISISSLIANPGLQGSDYIDISYNNLDCDDLADIFALKKRIVHYRFHYSPQNGLYPFDCNINTPIHIPDQNFRRALESFMGVSPDGIITAYDAGAKAGNLDCASQNILSASGIEYFSGIEGLNCNTNQLSSLDLCNNTALTYLTCHDNQLSNLNVLNVTDFVYVDCHNNQLPNISSLAANLGLGASDVVDVRYNNLTCDDWDDIVELQNRGVILSYSPQNGMDPFVCASSDNINTATNFPDPNFRSAVENFMGVAPGGIFTATDAAAKTDRLDCIYRNITDLTGIQFFTGIQELWCYGNHLTRLDVSHNTSLQHLACSNNHIPTLDVSHNMALEWLQCGKNQLTTLDISLNTALVYLDCNENQIPSLNLSNNTALETLYCYINELKSLDISNAPSLTSLHCSSNQLSSLQISDNQIYNYFNCSHNQLTNISGLAKSINFTKSSYIDLRYNNLSCDDLIDIITLQNWIGFDFHILPQNGMDPFACNINTPENFPDPNFRNAVENFMGVAPGGIILATDAVTKIGNLNCSNQFIQNVTGIEYFASIDGFNCSGNQLTNLNISINTALTNLTCSNNELASLIVPGSSALETIFCNNNLLTSLNISSASRLTFFDCSENQLTNLDVSHCSLLLDLNSYNNQLPSLDVSHNGDLESLICGLNYLATLDVSQNVDLISLLCEENNLQSLDVSGNPALESLFCYDNQLTSLNVSNCTALIDLHCSNNQLSNLSSLIANIGIGAGDYVDVSNNNLSCDDWAAVLVLQNRIGPDFYYSPQNGLDPFDCVSIDRSYLVNGDGLGGRYWPTADVPGVDDGYFDARFIPATALGGNEIYPAWCADMLTKIQLGKWYDNVSLYTSETSVCSLVDYPGHFALVNYLLVNYRIGTFDSLAPSNNEIQAVIWMLLFNGTPTIGGNGIDSGGYISWDQGIASTIYNSVIANGPTNPPDYSANPNLPVTIIIDTTDQVNLLEVPYWVYEELDGLGIVEDCQ